MTWGPAAAYNVEMRNLLPVLAGALAAVAATPAAAAPPAACRGADLSGSFTVVRGSGAAGQITYRLRVVDRSQAACFVTGIPQLGLRGLHGAALPTHATAAHPGMLTSVLVRLEPGAAASLTARFSPDVPGVGEPRAGLQCEPRAYRLLVTPDGGGTVSLPIRPPTPVCEHGRLSLSAFAASR